MILAIAADRLLAGLRAVPQTLCQAAALNGAGPWRHIRDLHPPPIAPQLFLTLVLKFIESITSIFVLIDTITQGRPGKATTLLVCKIHADGFRHPSCRMPAWLSWPTHHL